MDLWTAALFGHYKPKDLGWEKRAVPGDLIAMKPYGQDWTETEKKEFLVVTIEGPSNLQLSGLRELYWNMESYMPYNPIKKTAFEILQPRDDYDFYLEMEQQRCCHPTDHVKKRRFHISLDDLKKIGVDSARMLDMDKVYAPDLSIIDMTDISDKLRSRKIRHDDGLRELDELTVHQMIERANGLL